MNAETRFEDGQERSTRDHFVHLWGRSWDDYLQLLAIRGDSVSPRVQYLEGTIEIMSRSFDHEAIRSKIGMILGVWCLDQGIEFTQAGSWTLQEPSEERGAEPDDCYVFGSEPRDRPHLAIEVVWSTGGLDKLRIYGRLGVGEVWFWRKGRLTAHVLRDGNYVEVERSEALPDFDLARCAAALDQPTTSEAVRAFREGCAPSP